MIPQFHRPTRSNWWPQTGKKSKVSRQRCWIITVFILVISMFFFVIFLGFIFLPQNVEVSLEDLAVASVRHQPMVIPSSSRFIYIDVGCYNGETVEHFIHFNPNSSFYDIITFEPDPENFLLCEKVLRQPKYAHLSIQIIPKAVWVRDEKVSFQVGQGTRSRINTNISDTNGSIEVDAIDFSSWLGQLITSNQTKAQMKISIAGAEVLVLEKMVLEEKVPLVEHYEVEWLDRTNPRYRGERIYVQLMFDSYGFDCPYYTILADRRKAFQNNESWDSVPKLRDWRPLPEVDTFAHYIQRPVVHDPVIQPRREMKKI